MDENALPSRIANEIAELIAVGDIVPESHLSTQKLANRFEVSRTPVREALDLLAIRGVVEQRPNRGYFARATKTRKGPRKPTDVVHHSDGPTAYYNLAEDWLTDAVPAEVTEQLLLDRYKLTKGQLAAILNRATSEGWMERKAGYGWRLLPVAKTPEAQEQLYRIRMLLEPAAFLEPSFVLDRAMAQSLMTELQRVVDVAHLEWPADRLHALGVRFHEELLQMSGNPFLLQAVTRVNRMRRLLEYRTMIDRKRVVEESREHMEILQILNHGDVAGASYLMRQHLGRALARKRHGRTAPKGS